MEKVDEIPFKNTIYKPVSTKAPKIKALDEVLIEEEPSQKTEKGSCGALLDYCTQCAYCCREWCLCVRLCEENF